MHLPRLALRDWYITPNVSFQANGRGSTMGTPIEAFCNLLNIHSARIYEAVWLNLETAFLFIKPEAKRNHFGYQDFFSRRFPF